MMSNQYQPVQLYGRILGMYYWKCPACGHHCRTHFTPRSYKVKCTNKDCQHTFWHGSVMGECSNSRATPPRDMVMLSEHVWHAGDPVNKVICASCGDIIFERAKDTSSTSDLPVL